MSDQQQSMMDAPPLDEVLASLLHAVDDVARRASGAQDVREVQEYGAAAFNFAQAYSVLHPNVISPQGVAPEVLARSSPRPEPKPSTKGPAQ